MTNKNVTFKTKHELLDHYTYVEKGEELRIVSGAVLIPDELDGTETKYSSGDIYSEEEVRKAAHSFLADYEGQGLCIQHSGGNQRGISIVESYIAPGDLTIGKSKVKAGTWVLSAHVSDDGIWQQIRKGEITGFSIGGSARGTYED